jgi:hydrogenase-1 operon protein HyaF
MSKLEDIPVRVELSRPKAAKPDIVNLVLREIHAALYSLQSNGQTHTIDLRQLPRMSAEVYQALRDDLSQGEVSAVVDAEIKVEVAETKYPGVWWLRHLNERGEVTTEVIEITEMPTILMPHRVDIAAGIVKLQDHLLILAGNLDSVPLEF